MLTLAVLVRSCALADGSLGSQNQFIELKNVGDKPFEFGGVALVKGTSDSVSCSTAATHFVACRRSAVVRWTRTARSWQIHRVGQQSARIRAQVRLSAD